MQQNKKDIISRCGYKCNLCLAYRENIKSDADRMRFREGLLKYYRYPLTREQCYCDGCLADERENPILLTTDCKVRRCVPKKQLENCAYCELYPCKTLKGKFVNGKKVIEKYGAAIPKEDYDRFVGPYENRKILDAIRKKRRKATSSSSV